MSQKLYNEWKKIKFKPLERTITIYGSEELYQFIQVFGIKYQCSYDKGVITVHNPEPDLTALSLVETGQFVIPGIYTKMYARELKKRLTKLGISVIIEGNLVTRI